MKKSLRVLGIIACILVLASCKQDVAPVIQNSNLTTDVLVRDVAGNNLLSSTVVPTYKFSEIKLFTTENGLQSELINTGSSTFFQLVKGQNGETMLRISPKAGAKSQRSVQATIRWRTNDENTIEYTLTDGAPSGMSCGGHQKSNKTTTTATARVVEITK